MVKGQIRQSLSGYYDVMGEDGIEYRTRARGNFRKKGKTPLVGDWVDLKADKPKEGYILKIYPRKNELIRPPVANVDAAVVVTACIEPTFSSNLLDRQLLMLEMNNIKPILYFSKFDLLDDTETSKMQVIIEYYNQLYQTFWNSEHFEETSYARLLDALKKQIVVFMGQTGAGKSTLLNKLDPKLNLNTGEISKALSRGKHTTRKTTLLPIAESLLADTPGFSSFDILGITKEELPKLYPEFRRLAAKCKFRGCLHVNEPKCAVKDAVTQEKILASRYDNYLQFHKMILNQKPKY
ncbi:ribosome small subunit-dependent GTPase A [Ligilactobacillus sp. WILCCON 0076]|uniref:Small ribosomal subunit biogenesis GTPase RsgA n=1 Tax=Ligilactobacillus ubinensis TaxID=2876789 RepID=A0A9X2JLV1_9LACO|nr:ribosome small subunit-dependent GTPase A [Ligilactobacillus ubinensis]MCP0886995.1 ribosome small subunit-dependent GTPase A [Ligilactobacillus ubinensis]